MCGDLCNNMRGYVVKFATFQRPRSRIRAIIVQVLIPPAPGGRLQSSETIVVLRWCRRYRFAAAESRDDHRLWWCGKVLWPWRSKLNTHVV